MIINTGGRTDTVQYYSEWLLRRFAGTGVPAGFIHVPFLPQQAKNGEFSLPADQTARALEAAVRALQEP